MNGRNAVVACSVGAAVALAAFVAGGNTEGRKDQASKTTEASVVTNDNGSVTKAFTECNVTTNGNMVTERRRETRTTLDTEGNVLESSTSEYAQSYTMGDEGMASLSSSMAARSAAAEHADGTDSFLGLKLGEVFEISNLVSVAEEPSSMLLMAPFTPAKTLAGFDDYFVYVTPKTHRIVKVYACAKEAVEPGANWRRHYLIEALEKRYHTWARPRSWCRPLYAFDIGPGRYVTACLAGATREYETVLAAWDDAMLTVAADEAEEIRKEARKADMEKRQKRVSDAAAAF